VVVRWLHSIGDALQRLPRAICWTLVAAWFGLISWLSSIPGSQVPSSRVWAVITNLGHAPLFGLLALWIALLVPRKGGWPDLIPAHVARVLAAIAAFGIADELHQNFFTPGRDMSVFDICTDLAGASAVLAVAHHVGRADSGARGLAWRCAVGLAACIACACAATFIPRMFPSLVWL
jgi:VanZ family protein